MTGRRRPGPPSASSRPRNPDLQNGRGGDQYSYKVTNNGNVTITAPFTVRTQCADELSTDADQARADAFITCTASYTIGQSDLNGGSVTKLHRAGTSAPPRDLRPRQATVTAVQGPRSRS